MDRAFVETRIEPALPFALPTCKSKEKRQLISIVLHGKLENNLREIKDHYNGH